MTNLVKIENGQLVTNSRIVAKAFDKQHAHVLRDIAAYEKDVSNFGDMFHLTMLPDSYGRMQKVYLMNRDGFSLLAMGFTGKKALAWKAEFIRAFNEMEKELKENISLPSLPDFTNPAEAARAWAAQYEARQKAQKELEAAKPKIVFSDSVSISDTDIPVGTLAKILNQNGVDIGRNRLFQWLRDHGYLMSGPKEWNQPRQKFVKDGLFKLSEITVNRGYLTPTVRLQTYVTGKGQQFFINAFLGKQ